MKIDINKKYKTRDGREVKEKKQLTGFVNVYENVIGKIHSSKEEANESGKVFGDLETRIACIDLSQYEIFYEENEGL